MFFRILISVLLFAAVASAASAKEPTMAEPMLIRTFDVLDRNSGENEMHDLAGTHLPGGDFLFLYRPDTYAGSAYHAVRFDSEGRALWRRKVCESCIPPQPLPGQLDRLAWGPNRMARLGAKRKWTPECDAWHKLRVPARTDSG